MIWTPHLTVPKTPNLTYVHTGEQGRSIASTGQKKKVKNLNFKQLAKTGKGGLKSIVRYSDLKEGTLSLKRLL